MAEITRRRTGELLRELFNILMAPRKRPKEVQKAKALARISVGYCSGSHRLYMAKLPPARPRKNRTIRNGCNPCGRWKAQPKARTMQSAMPQK